MSDARAPSPRYVALLALVSLAVLGIGYAVKPAPESDEVAVRAPSPAEVRRLQRLALRRSVDSVTEYLSLAARDVAPYVVQVGNDGGTGVVWETDFVVSTPIGWSPSSAVSVTTDAGDLVPAGASVAGPHLPLAGFRTPMSQGLSPAPRLTDLLEPSQWLVAVWRSAGSLSFAPANAAGSMRTTCNGLPVRAINSTLTLSAPMAGGGLFDLDGRLAGLILPCDDGLAILTTPSVDTLLMRGQLLESRLLARYGLWVGALEEAERAHFDLESGVVVREVWRGYPADRVGLQPGDVVLAVDEESVAATADMTLLLSPATADPFRLTVRRGASELEIELTPGALPLAEEEAEVEDRGLVLDAPQEGFVIEAVVPGTPADRAGIQAGDRLLRIDHAPPRSRAALQRALAARPGDRGVFVELERGPRRWGALLGG